MNQPEKEGVAPVSKRIISAAVVAWLFLLLAMLVLALMFHFFYLPEGAIPWVGKILSYIAAFLCGFRAAKDARKKGFLKGFWAGVLFVVIYIVLMLVLQAKVQIGNFVLFPVLSLLGGIVGINLKTKR